MAQIKGLTYSLSKLHWFPFATAILGLTTCMISYIVTITDKSFPIPPILPWISFLLIYPPSDLISGIGFSVFAVTSLISATIYKIDLGRLIDSAYGDKHGATSYQQSSKFKKCENPKSVHKELSRLINVSFLFSVLASFSIIVLCHAKLDVPEHEVIHEISATGTFSFLLIYFSAIHLLKWRLRYQDFHPKRFYTNLVLLVLAWIVATILASGLVIFPRRKSYPEAKDKSFYEGLMATAFVSDHPYRPLYLTIAFTEWITLILVLLLFCFIGLDLKDSDTMLLSQSEEMHRLCRLRLQPEQQDPEVAASF